MNPLEQVNGKLLRTDSLRFVVFGMRLDKALSIGRRHQGTIRRVNENPFPYSCNKTIHRIAKDARNIAQKLSPAVGPGKVGHDRNQGVRIPIYPAIIV